MKLRIMVLSALICGFGSSSLLHARGHHHHHHHHHRHHKSQPYFSHGRAHGFRPYVRPNVHLHSRGTQYPRIHCHGAMC